MKKWMGARIRLWRIACAAEEYDGTGLLEFGEGVVEFGLSEHPIFEGIVE